MWAITKVNIKILYVIVLHAAISVRKRRRKTALQERNPAENAQLEDLQADVLLVNLLADVLLADLQADVLLADPLVDIGFGKLKRG
ncbi:hypothetical protein [Pseudalkalibacillus berkeleyi]|uniref:Uncharacterized protein n=1 Tax=Pseudalkalibacillus berkeleyi TaxID=1069813 RepID=A0ABS9GYP7_9BACL|nr:hypothetical protein [Pseudalkalibacillus berkeleyi]MCF6136936.1 hypothetical protein [Pseudalkalibacillus berkeleyi]